MTQENRKNVAILAANGKTGRLLVKEALLQGARVSAFVRSDFDRVWLEGALKNEGIESGVLDSVLARLGIIQKDIFSLEAADLSGFDVVVSAFGAWSNVSLHKKHILHLVQILSDTNAHLYVVGGAGSLYMDKTLSVRLVDTPSFPSEYKPLSLAMAEGLEALREVGSAITWCYVSPAAEFVEELPKGQSVRIIGDVFETNSRGESKIGYADYAAKLIEIALDSKLSSDYKNRRIGLIGE